MSEIILTEQASGVTPGAGKRTVYTKPDGRLYLVDPSGAEVGLLRSGDITGTNSGTNTGDQVIPTTLPASDVSAWAKEATKPAYTAAEVGLPNADNTSDATKDAAIATLANKTLTSPDINGGTVDGTVIGGEVPAAGAFTTLSASGKIVTNAPIYTGFDANFGTSAAGNPAVGIASLGDAPFFHAERWDGGTNWNGFRLYANNTSGGELGVYVGSGATRAGQVFSKVSSFTSTGLNNTVIGATTPAAGSFTTLSATGGINVESTTVMLNPNTGVEAPYVGSFVKWKASNTATAWRAQTVQPTNVYSDNGDLLFSYGNDAIEVLRLRNAWSVGGLGLFVTGTLSTTGALTTAGLKEDAAGNLGLSVIPTPGINACLQLKDGIKFPATQVASSDPNVLDDYEEGTWTPILAGSETAGSFNQSVQIGKYTKIGNMVTLYAAITSGTPTGLPTGNLTITGLPFSCGAGTSANGFAQISQVGQSSSVGVTFSTRGASSILYINYIATNNTSQIIQAGVPVTGTIIDFCISYPVN